MWSSDGSGTYDLAQVDNFHLDHGTRVVLHLKPSFVNYTRPDEIKGVVEKYSNFISHPIFVNHEKVNLVSALWVRDKRDVSEEEYRLFYEHITRSKGLFRWKLHFGTDVPMSVKALLYFPFQNNEKTGLQTGEVQVDLYSRKVLIKKNCKELVPHYLRFVRGVVDCEDLPLNISRENYQDSHLIAKLRSIVSKRILRHLEAESKSNLDEFLIWYRDFHMFLKEGAFTDHENAQQILALCRYDSSFAENVTLDQYLEKMRPGQKNIYYFLAASRRRRCRHPLWSPS